MTHFFGIFGSANQLASTGDAAEILGSEKSPRTQFWRGSGGSVAGPECSTVSLGDFDGEWHGWFAGDLPGLKRIPWERRVRALIGGDDAFIAALNGYFAMLPVHEPSGEVWALSDRRAQQPLFSYSSADAACLSTTASTLTRLPSPPAFDPQWLHETIYFNHQVLDRSFLGGVSRVPPATLLTWRPGDPTFTYRTWAAPFWLPSKLARGREASDLEQTTFSMVAADQFADLDRTEACVLLAPNIERRLGNAELPTNVLHGRPLLSQLERVTDLLVCESRTLHRPLLLLDGGRQSKLSPVLNCPHLLGGRQLWRCDATTFGRGILSTTVTTTRSPCVV